MKDRIICLAAALLAAALAGCAGPSSSQSSSPPPASSAAPSSAVSSQPTAPGRELHTELEIWVEGEPEKVPATLFQGEGYSLYLPDGEWVQTGSMSGEQPEEADLFAAAANSQVTLSVRPDRSGQDLERAYDALWAEGYNQSDDNDHFFARTMEGQVQCQYVIAGESRVWYVAWSYPDTSEYLEGWGSRIPQLMPGFLLEEDAGSSGL
ncbi:MAG: hypothetical protein KH706_03580 [Faecalibacterium prausnitzii]|nr:hypothetical protein [Faecalibacterium prausnitzii]